MASITGSDLPSIILRANTVTSFAPIVEGQTQLIKLEGGIVISVTTYAPDDTECNQVI